MNRNTLLKWAPLLVLVLLIALFTAVNANFLSVRNFARLATAAAPPLMVALGVTFIIVMGSIDLSMEGTISVCAVIFGFAFMAWGGTLLSMAWLAIPMTLILGALIGTVVFLSVEHVIAAINPFHWLTLIGLMLIAVVLFAPGGLAGLVARLAKKGIGR